MSDRGRQPLLCGPDSAALALKLLRTADRSEGGNLRHGELDRIAKETCMTKAALVALQHGNSWGRKGKTYRTAEQDRRARQLLRTAYRKADGYLQADELQRIADTTNISGPVLHKIELSLVEELSA